MRKLTVLILCLALVSILGASALEKHQVQENQRVWHHRQAASAASCDGVPAGEFCSHLPLVFIETGGQDLSQSYEVPVEVRTIDNQGGHNHLSGTPSLVATANIKYRGNSSSRFDKRQYRLTFVQENDATQTRNLPVLGMPAESDWVLNGPFLDRTMLRNYLMYNLAGDIMAWSPNVRYCEVFVDGGYQGLYLMIEAVKVAADRVNVTRVVSDQSVGGYLVARERPGDTKYALADFGTYAGKTTNELGISYPGRKVLTLPHAEEVRRDLSEFEKMLYSLDYDDAKAGYAAWIDIQSFVDYFLINELSLNSDAGALSSYTYKDVRSKLFMGPVWDFNNAFDNYQYAPVDLYDFCLLDGNWYVMLLRDEVFVSALIERYYALRKDELAEERLMGLIDETIAWLGPAVDRNFDRWGYTFQMVMLDDEDAVMNRDPKNYEEAVAQLKYTLHEHGAFLDQYMPVIQQFCAESAVKEWN